jgi:serine/threonine-protein kinase
MSDAASTTASSGPSANKSALFPRPFGRYTLLSPLAEGGMGALYLGCQGELGMEKLCVIKTVLPHLADKEYVARFRDEAKVVVRLSHGNLVPVFDAGVVRTTAGEELYLAMEHVDGKDLRAVWNRCAKKGVAFPIDIAVYIARELARGLYHAHSAGAIKLVHRDVSPPNVLLSFSGEVKLTDFGLASSTLKTEKTAPGIVYGKVSYMSPEQARGEVLDGRTDLYAVAIMLWELLTGRQMFPQGEENLMERVRDPQIVPPSQLAQRVPPQLDVIVVKALSKDKTLRYLDCEAFRAALSGFLAQHAPTTDNDRVARFLEQLFGDEIMRDRAERQQLLEQAAESRVLTPHGQMSSQPETVPATKRPPPANSGDIINSYLDDRYLVKRLLGEGGMGLVYEAEHVEIGRRVAVKVLHAMYTRQADVVARFRAEARAATRIGHPHIVEVLDSGTTVDGAVYFVMEYLAGQNLAELIKSGGPLGQKRAVAIGREICQALAAAHKAGIVHRDMKPENVFLIERDGHKDFVKVLDFGIAKTLEQTTDKVGRLTQPGMAMGTPEYMAPEQAAGAATDHRADIYAVGAMLYEMLSGKPPHEGENVMEILTKKATIAPTPVGQLRTDVDRDLERLVMRCLAQKAEGRPSSMDELTAELGRLTALGSGAVVRGSVSGGTERLPKSRAGVIAVAVVMALGLAAGVTLWAMRGPKTPPVDSAPKVEAPKVETPKVEPPKVEAAKVEAPKVEVAKTEPPKTEPRKVISVDPVTVKRTTPKPEHVAKPAAVEKPADNNSKKMLADARRALAEQRFAEAQALFAQAETAGARGPALTGLAEIAFQRGNYGESLPLAKRAVDSGGGVAARLLLGNSYFKLKRWDEAIGEYQTVLKAQPGNVEAQSNLSAAERKKSGGGK